MRTFIDTALVRSNSEGNRNHLLSFGYQGWVLPEKVSNDPNLESWQTVESSGVDPVGIAIKRLLALEKSVERRYLKPPLSKT